MVYMRVCQDKDTAYDFRPQIAALSPAGKPGLIICLSPLTEQQTGPLCRIFLFVLQSFTFSPSTLHSDVNANAKIKLYHVVLKVYAVN